VCEGILEQREKREKGRKIEKVLGNEIESIGRKVRSIEAALT
jgi:hypothetical protein